MNVAFRVLVGVFVCVAPSALFLGLWHGLERLQDDELVERFAEHQGVAVEDLVPGANSYRGDDFDSAQRRIVERFGTDDAHETHPHEAFGPDERDPS